MPSLRRACRPRRQHHKRDMTTNALVGPTVGPLCQSVLRSPPRRTRWSRCWLVSAQAGVASGSWGLPAPRPSAKAFAKRVAALTHWAEAGGAPSCSGLMPSTGQERLSGASPVAEGLVRVQRCRCRRRGARRGLRPDCVSSAVRLGCSPGCVRGHGHCVQRTGGTDEGF